MVHFINLLENFQYFPILLRAQNPQDDHKILWPFQHHSSLSQTFLTSSYNLFFSARYIHASHGKLYLLFFKLNFIL